MSLSIGQEAPDFALYNTEKNKIALRDYRGRPVLILFFPLAFSGVCTAELCSVRDSLSVYEGLQADILGISVDSLFTLNKFKQEHNLPFELLADFNKEVAEAYGCLNANFSFEMRGVARRSAFVVDAEGKVQYAEVLENAGDLPNFEAIQQCLQSLNA